MVKYEKKDGAFGSYIVYEIDDVDSETAENETIELKMLKNNKIPGVLTYDIRYMDDKFCLYYDIKDMISMKYAGALATIEIGTTVDIENELVIIGSNGRVTIPNDWWNTGYFEANISGKEFLKRYSFNFEGNGFRYLLQELMIMIRDKRTECTRLFYDESVRIIEILETINRKDNS